MYNVSVPVVPGNFVSAEPYLLASDYLESTRSNDDSKLEMKNEYIIQLNFKRWCAFFSPIHALKLTFSCIKNCPFWYYWSFYLMPVW